MLMQKISFFSRLLDLIAPRRCVACGRRLLMEEDELCLSCLIQLERTYFWKHPKDNALAAILDGQAALEKAASWLFYRGNKCRDTIHALKYWGRNNAGYVYGMIMANEIVGSGFFDDIDVIVPVPLAKNRLRQRGYNQSLAIAKGISWITNIKIVDNAMKRKKFKQSQTKLSHYERKNNVENQFSVVDSSLLVGKHILVIDDVITTGATILACISPLSNIEGVKVSVLSMAFAGI